MINNKEKGKYDTSRRTCELFDVVPGEIYLYLDGIARYEVLGIAPKHSEANSPLAVWLISKELNQGEPMFFYNPKKTLKEAGYVLEKLKTR